MKNKITAIVIFTAYFALIGYAIFITQSAWPLVILLLATPKIVINSDTKSKST